MFTITDFILVAYVAVFLVSVVFALSALCVREGWLKKVRLFIIAIPAIMWFMFYKITEL